MSSDRRPWFPWYPRDYVSDEKTRGLSDDADLVYRRALDVIWQANALQLPCNCTTLANQLARGWSAKRFKEAWEEIMRPGFELLKTTDDGQWVYSKRLLREADKIAKLSKKRSLAAIAKQMHSKCSANAPHLQCHTDTDTDIKKKYRKKKLPTDFSVTPAMQTWFKQQSFRFAHIDSETEKFKDHFTGSGDTKLDWVATWRNWMRKAEQYNTPKKRQYGNQSEPSYGKTPKCESCGVQADNIEKGKPCPFCGKTV